MIASCISGTIKHHQYIFLYFSPKIILLLKKASKKKKKKESIHKQICDNLH